MSQPNFDTHERPFPLSRIQRDGHRHSGAERRGDQLVWIGSAIRPAGRHWLVGGEVMPPGDDLLHESLRSPANDDKTVPLSHNSS
jgi:hypothetical protein